MGGTAQARADGVHVSRGVADGRVASAIAAAHGPEMGRAILALYRSAAQPAMADLGRELERAAQRPGLCLLATRRPVVGSEPRSAGAAAASGGRARCAVDAGHWWHIEDPEAAAPALERFWRRVDLLDNTQAAAA